MRMVFRIFILSLYFLLEGNHNIYANSFQKDTHYTLVASQSQQLQADFKILPTQIFTLSEVIFPTVLQNTYPEAIEDFIEEDEDERESFTCNKYNKNSNYFVARYNQQFTEDYHTSFAIFWQKNSHLSFLQSNKKYNLFCSLRI